MEEKWMGHRERLRLRAENEGIEEFRHHEILELIISYALPRVDTSQMAIDLINHFGSLQDVLHADLKQLKAVPGIGTAVADWIVHTGNLLKLYERSLEAEPNTICCFRDVSDYLRPWQNRVEFPESWIVYADFENNLMMHSVISESLSWAEPEYVIHTVEECIALQAKYAFIALFTGDKGLDLDYECFHLPRFARTLRAAGVELMDCVVVESEKIRSLNLEGKMDIVRQESLARAFHESYADYPEEGE